MSTSTEFEGTQIIELAINETIIGHFGHSDLESKAKHNHVQDL